MSETVRRPCEYRVDDPGPETHTQYADRTARVPGMAPEAAERGRRP